MAATSVGQMARGRLCSHAGYHQHLGVGQRCGGGLATGELDEWVGVAVHDQSGCCDLTNALVRSPEA